MPTLTYILRLKMSHDMYFRERKCICHFQRENCFTNLDARKARNMTFLKVYIFLWYFVPINQDGMF